MSQKKELLKKVAKDSKETDQFIQLTDRVLSWVNKNTGLLISFVIICIVAGASYATFDWYNQKQEKEARSAFTPIEKKHKDWVLKKNDKDQKNKDDLKKTANEIVNDYNKVISDFASTKSSLLGALGLANIHLEMKDLDEAIEVLKTASDKHIGNGRIQSLLEASIVMLHGAVLAEKNDCKQAIAQWGKVVKEDDVSYFRAEALLKQAICHEELQEFSQAEGLYQRILKDFPKTEPGRRAKSYLRYRKVFGSEQKEG